MKADDVTLQVAYILTWGLVPLGSYMIAATWWLLTGRTIDHCVYLMRAQVECAKTCAFIGSFIIICLMFVKIYMCSVNKLKQREHISELMCFFNVSYDNGTADGSSAAFAGVLLMYFEVTMVLVVDAMLSFLLKQVDKPKFADDRFYVVNKRTKAPAAANDCSICLHEINKGDYFLQLSCKHMYHYDCMTGYLMHLISERKGAEQVEDANHYIYTGQCGICRETCDFLRVCKTDTTKTF